MDQHWDTIAAIDLTSVRNKFLARKGFWWRMSRDARQIENEYRQFLYMVATNPGQTVVPWSQDVDDFWHEHILNTQKYAEDCQAIMGGFIHHDPHLPKGSSGHTKAFAATQKMYETAFKETIRKRRNGDASGIGCSTNMPAAFGDGGSAGHHGGAHSGGGHGGGGHHGCGGHGGGHGCGGHGCGGGGH